MLADDIANDLIVVVGVTGVLTFTGWVAWLCRDPEVHPRHRRSRRRRRVGKPKRDLMTLGFAPSRRA